MEWLRKKNMLGGSYWEGTVTSEVDITWLLNHEALLIYLFLERSSLRRKPLHLHLWKHSALCSFGRMNMTFRGCRSVMSCLAWGLQFWEDVLVRCQNTRQSLRSWRVGCSQVLDTPVCAPLQALNSLIAVKPLRFLQQFLLQRGCI